MRRGTSRQEECTAYLRSAIPSLMGLAMSMTGRRHDAEDLVQETSSLVIAKWPKVSQADDVDAYVRRIMVNTLMSSRRPRWRSEIVSSETVTQDHRHRPAADPASDVAERDEVHRLLSGLPPRQRAVIGLRYYADLPDGEIATLLGCSAQAVRSAAHTAMRSLRGTLTRSTASESS